MPEFAPLAPFEAMSVTLHPVSVVLVAAALAATFALIVAALRGRYGLVPSLQRGSRRLEQVYRACNAPAIASASSGRVSWLNAAAEKAGFRPGTHVTEQLGDHYDVDPACVYRLSQRALEQGFALAAVEDRETRQRCYLAAQSFDRRDLLWTIQQAHEIMPGALGERDVALEFAEFGHAAVAPDGRIATNARFRDLFGVHAKKVLEFLPADRPPEGGRIALPVKDAGYGIFRVFLLTDATDDRRDYLFFPVADSGIAPTGLAGLLDAVPVGLLGLDHDGRILWCNAVARRLVGDDVRPGSMLAEKLDPLGKPISSMIQTAALGLQGTREMVRLANGAGDTFLQISITPTRLDENDTLIAVLADASQIRQLEDQFAQSQRMEAVGKLAGGVAHDFNNVLTAISGHADLLLLGKDVNHPDFADLTQIRQNANRAAALIRQLLAFSRKQTLAPCDLSLRDVISDTLYLLDRLIGEKVTLRLEHARELGSVRADRQQLEQALMNLVVNARDALADGGIVTISTRNCSFDKDARLDQINVPAGEYVEITVDDNGPGIPEPILDRIFEPFFTTKTMGEGTGLGLSTVYGIVKQSGGLLTASNRPGGGARFRILLPRIAAEAARDREKQVEVRAGGADMTGRGLVLLVEDEAPVRSFASRALTLRGYQVKAADSAEAAMEYLSDTANPVDLLVSDVVMPGMDGPTFAVEARRLRPGLPVIFVSGYAEDSFRNSLMDQDFMFLSKPFSLTELTAKVKDALTAGAAAD